MMHRIHAAQWYRRERMSEQDERPTCRQDDVKLKAKDSTTLDSIDLNRSPSSMVWWGRRHL